MAVARSERYERAKQLLTVDPNMSTRKLAKEIGVSSAMGFNYIKRFKDETRQELDIAVDE